MNVYGLAKIARSWQAKQRRLYERMLKSLHGGTEGYMKHVRESGSRAWPEIYHGGKADDLQKLLQEGVDENYVGDTIYGPGLYFGTKDVAMRYARDGIVRLKTPIEITNRNVSYPSADRVVAIDFERKHPKFSDYGIARTLPPDQFPEQIPATNQLMYYGLADGKHVFENSRSMGGKQFHIRPDGGLNPELFKGYHVDEFYDEAKDDIVKRITNQF